MKCSKCKQEIKDLIHELQKSLQISLANQRILDLENMLKSVTDELEACNKWHSLPCSELCDKSRALLKGGE